MKKKIFFEHVSFIYCIYIETNLKNKKYKKKEKHHIIHKKHYYNLFSAYYNYFISTAFEIYIIVYNYISNNSKIQYLKYLLHDFTKNYT